MEADAFHHHIVRLLNLSYLLAIHPDFDLHIHWPTQHFALESLKGARDARALHSLTWLAGTSLIALSDALQIAMMLPFSWQMQ